MTNKAAADELVDPIHPVIIRHPLSGKEALYVNPGFTRHFLGWTIEESEPLLELLYQKAVAEARICKFQWQPGSIAFWDNRATWHFAQNDYQGQRREYWLDQVFWPRRMVSIKHPGSSARIDSPPLSAHILLAVMVSK